MGARTSSTNSLPAAARGAETPSCEDDSERWWVQGRWEAILDRIEFRRSDVGLRFWGPPVWLEVTMTGADSDLWPADTGESRSWDWQSSEPCAGVPALVHDGADDDQLLEVVGRYAIENLILNAVHEIGEWFRFDGHRVFPAHSPNVDPRDQGNGGVELQVTFPSGPDAAGPPPPPDGLAHPAGGTVAAAEGAPARAGRYTYMPATTIGFDDAGPVICRYAPGEPPREFRSNWTSPNATVEPAGGEASPLARLDRDLHRALVSYEADRICRAFFIDGTRPWYLHPDHSRAPDGHDRGATGGAPLGLSLRYHSTGGRPDALPSPVPGASAAS
ncbi:MAG: hypothetical protein KGQ66_02610 [Acidobacteriota bacterium]|nr:hypothetical protein [Acidobacteriota bacterium]